METPSRVSYYTGGFPQLIKTETKPSDDIIRWHAFQNRVTPAFCSSDFNSSQGTPSITVTTPPTPPCGVNASSLEERTCQPRLEALISSLRNTKRIFLREAIAALLQ
ncbi:hypothetical protein NQZ68_012670 [Dissostichus eleginoides]|nr:hypothetical protein NQZ68_012670 [Dissostichus eleginoides]